MGPIPLQDDIRVNGTFSYPASDTPDANANGMPLTEYAGIFKKDGDFDRNLKDNPMELARNVRIIFGFSEFRADLMLSEQDLLPGPVAQVLAVLFGGLIDLAIDTAIAVGQAAAEAEIRRELEKKGFTPAQIEAALKLFREALNSPELEDAKMQIGNIVTRILAEIFGKVTFNPVRVTVPIVTDSITAPPLYRAEATGGMGSDLVRASQKAFVTNVRTRQQEGLTNRGLYRLDLFFQIRPEQSA